MSSWGSAGEPGRLFREGEDFVQRDGDDILSDARETHIGGPEDAVLVAGFLDGEEKPMRALIDRYDRLIRYSIFKTGKRYCDRDPGWLDARANETWTAIVKSLRKAGKRSIPANIPAYFTQIARNKCLDAVKKADASPIISFNTEQDNPIEKHSEAEASPLMMLENLEQLDSLRDCMSRLNEKDQILCSEVGLIMERRWREAAKELEMAESTLRSRWRGVVVKLKACLENKTKKK